MITGPLRPAGAMWMCAAVPTTPEVLTLPLTVWSSLMVIGPLPAASVLTGGTSSAPASFTLSLVNTAFVESHAPLIVSQPDNASAAAATSMGIAARNLVDIVIHPSFGSVEKSPAWHAGPYGTTILQDGRAGPVPRFGH